MPLPFRGTKSALIALLLSAVVAGCSKPSADERMAAAKQHIAQNNWAAAQIELRNAIQLAPANGQAQRLLGSTQLVLGDPAAAEVALRKALTLSEKVDDVLPSLALAMLRQGRDQKLIDEFGSVTLQDPAANAALRASVGQAWLLRGDATQATAAFAAALAAQPGNGPALLGQARIVAHEGKLDDATALTDAALKADPRLAEAHAFKGQLLVANGQRQPAIEALEKALAVDGNYVPARLALASILIDAKDYGKAKAVLGAARVAKDPRLHFLQALIAMREGELAKAGDAVAAVLKAAPDYGPALLLAGELDLRAGNLAMADQNLSKALTLRASPDVRRLLAATQLRQNRPGKALETLQPLLQDAGAIDPAVALLAGEAHLARGDVLRAGEYFEASRSSGANDALARTRLGQLALTRGDVERGVEELQAASAIAPQTVEPDLLLFTAQLRRQEPAKALAAAQAFIQKQPKNPLGHVLAGTAQTMQRDRAAARRSFEAALAIKPDHVPALRALADLDVVEGKAADAQRRYDALLAGKPDDEQLLVAVAALQERTGRADDALKTLRKAVAANPRARDPAVALVQHHLRRNDAGAALKVVQEAVRNNPDELSLAMLLGMTQEAAGAGKDAIRTLTALVLKEPHALAPLVRLAQIQARQRDFDGAARTLVRAQEKAPHNETLSRELAGVYMQAGKFEQALKVAKDFQVQRPDAAWGHVAEGDAHALAKKWPEAERAYRAALKVDPRASAAGGKVYRVLLATGKRKEAAGFAAEWLTRNPSDMAMRLLVADAALRSRNLPVAIRQYEDVLRILPDQPLVLNNLARALGQTKDPKALSVAARAASLAPNSPDVLDTLGMLHLQAGDAAKGLEALGRVRELAPDRPDLRLHYAKALLQNGRTQEGKAELRELAATRADFPGKADIPALLGAP